MEVATERIVQRFDVTRILNEIWERREQVPPTVIVPVITMTGSDTRQLEGMKWGIETDWIKKSGGRPIINARAETIAEKDSFKDFLPENRCIVPADGFYEWSAAKNDHGKKDMYWFGVGNREIFGFAGFYDDERHVCLITCEPNSLVGAIHHRMPAILSPEHEETWLASKYDPTLLEQVLRPYPKELMKAEICITAK